MLTAGLKLTWNRPVSVSSVSSGSFKCVLQISSKPSVHTENNCSSNWSSASRTSSHLWRTPPASAHPRGLKKRPKTIIILAISTDPTLSMINQQHETYQILILSWLKDLMAIWKYRNLYESDLLNNCVCVWYIHLDELAEVAPVGEDAITKLLGPFEVASHRWHILP